MAIELGVATSTVELLMARFPGVARRFEVVGTTASGIRVVDDYAHNGEKLRAAISTAQAGAARVVALFQPHGYGPARFLRPELRALIPALLPRVLQPDRAVGSDRHRALAFRQVAPIDIRGQDVPYRILPIQFHRSGLHAGAPADLAPVSSLA